MEHTAAMRVQLCMWFMVQCHPVWLRCCWGCTRSVGVFAHPPAAHAAVNPWLGAVVPRKVPPEPPWTCTAAKLRLLSTRCALSPAVRLYFPCPQEDWQEVYSIKVIAERG